MSRLALDSGLQVTTFLNLLRPGHLDMNMLTSGQGCAGLDGTKDVGSRMVSLGPGLVVLTFDPSIVR